MNNVEGFNKNLIKAKIQDTTYIKVSNLLNGELYGSQGQVIINTTLYRKDENGYESVTPLEIPIEHMNELSFKKSYKLMNKDEIKDFLDEINNSLEKIKNNNKFITSYDEVIIGHSADVYYVVNKQKDLEYYSLSGIKVNSLGEIKEQYTINPNELPYVIIDILNNNPTITNRTFIIAVNTFVHVHKEEDKLILMVGFINDNENFSSGEVGKEQINSLILRIRGIYTLAINNNRYTFLNEKESEVLLNINEETKLNILNEFKENIEKM